MNKIYFKKYIVGNDETMEWSRESEIGKIKYISTGEAFNVRERKKAEISGWAMILNTFRIIPKLKPKTFEEYESMLSPGHKDFKKALKFSIDQIEGVIEQEKKKYEIIYG